MCGFGIHMEKDHIDLTFLENGMKRVGFWMYEMGWGHVLDYIGVDWENKYISTGEQLRLEMN